MRVSPQPNERRPDRSVVRARLRIGDIALASSAPLPSGKRRQLLRMSLVFLIICIAPCHRQAEGCQQIDARLPLQPYLRGCIRESQPLVKWFDDVRKETCWEQPL